MSLINDALKKAQRQQSGGAPAPTPAETPAPGGAPAPRIERREKPADFRSQMLVLGGVSAGLLIALVVGGFFWWRSSHPSEAAPQQPVTQTTASTTTAPQSAAANPATVQPKPEPAKVEPVKIEPAATTTAATGSPQFTLPLAPSTTASTAPATTTASTTPSVQLPAATTSTEPVKLAPADRPKPSNQMIKTIDAYRVTGIRASGGESKVLMNDRVYRLGDTVDIELGIKLTGVAQGALTFENAQGAVYTRNF